MIEADEYPPPGEFMNPLDIGLFDLTKNGWFDAGTGELLPGYPVGPDDIVADIGCGEGGLVRFCTRMGARAVVVDARADRVEMLVSQLRQAGGQAEGHVADAARLPVADEAVSRVICTEVLEHVDDPAAVMAELVRIGRPGALYLISVPDPASERLLDPVAPASYTAPPNHVRVLARDAFQDLVRGAGLAIEGVRYEGFYWTLYLAALWASRAAEPDPGGETLDNVAPPFPEFGQRWARLWFELASMADFDPVRRALDQALPKTQLIVARKPGATA
jgi:SAM-dependent methyltransferase